MSSKETIWVLFALLVAVLDLAVPYTVLKNVAKFSGPYLYWTALALIVVVFGSVYISRWRSEITLEGGE